jgi:hypothetical protein
MRNFPWLALAVRLNFHVISHLDHRYAAEVEDIISPPERDLYTTLRSELVWWLTPSRGQRICQLLMIEEMGDCKPSQFLRHLRSLAPQVPEDFLSTIWSSWLPPNIQAHLACQPECSLDVAARCVDRISKVAPHPVVTSVSLKQEIEDLTRPVTSLSAKRDRLRATIRDQCGLSNVRDAHVLTPPFSAAVTQTHTGSCWP